MLHIRKKLFVSAGVLLMSIALLVIITYINDSVHRNRADAELSSRYELIHTETFSVIQDINSIENKGTPQIQETEILEETIVYNQIDFAFNSNPMSELLLMNSHYVGWISIDNTRIDYPVVQAGDNEYYLDHGFDRKKNSAGSIFMDYRNTGTWRDKHTIVYGHYQRDGSMFRDLHKFASNDFYTQNRIITVRTLYGEISYKPIAAYTTKADPLYIRTRLEGESFNEFKEFIMSRTIHDWEYDISEEDSILTLSTCAYDYSNARFVVHAVRLDD